MPNKKRNTKVLDSVEGYDKYAPYYEQSHKFLDSFEREHFYGMLGDLKGKKVLDMGCGAGRLIELLLMSGADVYAADISENMISTIQKKYPRLKTCVCSIEDIDFEDNFFDIVLSAFVVVHLRTLTKAFDEVYRVLKPGGHFVLSNINQKKPPALKVGDKEEIIIKSFYHMPKNIILALEESFFDVKDEKFVYEGRQWINQIVRAGKG